MSKLGVNRKGQVTIFVIVAIIIVASGIAYFLLRDTIAQNNIPEEFRALENSYLDCIEGHANDAVEIVLLQGGYINLPEFVSGSSYMPFSSELYFAGIKIPYWHYFTGNNIEVENVPTKSFIEEEVANYVKSQIPNCQFSSYYPEGYSVLRDDADVEVEINDDDVLVEVNQGMTYSKGENKVLIKDHAVLIKSKLGSLYDDAVEFYSQEKEENLLENYTIDVLRLYAPVDGVLLSCAPKTWNADEIFNSIKGAVETNFMFLKNYGSKEDYFNLDLDIDSQINFLNSQSWPKTYEVSPTEDNLLIAEPIGNQGELGILGFCYIPYHFIYDLKFPVLVQVSEDDEVFQFPLAVVIDNNQQGVYLPDSNFGVDEGENVCENSIIPTTIRIYGEGGSLVEGNVTFECFNKCNLGSTENGELNTLLPQCVNGKIKARSEGYKEGSLSYSSVQEGSASIFLDKIYEREISLELGSRPYLGNAIISFVSSDFSKTIAYPETKVVEIPEGTYEVSVYAYDDSKISFPETTRQECVEVPSSFLGGLLGTTEEKCTEVTVPAQEINSVLIGGGKKTILISNEDLLTSNEIKISADRFNIPTTIEGVQQNYVLFESKSLEVSFL